MKEKHTQNESYVLITFVFGAALTLNFLAVETGHKPFLYCWGRPFVWPIYSAFANVANLFALLYMFGVASRFEVAKTIKAMVVVLLVMGTPTYADILFRMGGKCG